MMQHLNEQIFNKILELLDTYHEDHEFDLTSLVIERV